MSPSSTAFRERRVALTVIACLTVSPVTANDNLGMSAAPTHSYVEPTPLAAGISSGTGSEPVGVGLTPPARGAAVSLGAFSLYPTAGLSLGHNDNVTGANTNPIGSAFHSVRVGLLGEHLRSGDRYTLSYDGDYTRYTNSSEDDYNHHTLLFGSDVVFSSRAALGLNIGYLERTDPRGATDRPISNAPDKWHSPLVRALFAYGARDAKGRIELEAGWQDKTYDNNRATTAGSDVILTNAAARFYYRVRPKTYLLFEVRENHADYHLASSLNDNRERRYLFGATWEATAATTGIVKLGRLEKRFDSPSRQDFSGSSWEATVRWRPRTFSTIDLTTSKATSDSTGIGDYLLNKNIQLAWIHKWSSLLSSRVHVGQLNTDYEGSSTRADTIRRYGVGLTYQWRRWLQTGVEWQRTKRNSNIDTFDYDRDLFMVTLEGTL